MTAVILTILPVFGVVLAGWVIAQTGLITEEGIDGLTNVTFYLFMPAMLFRAMGAVHLDALDTGPLLAYYGSAILVFGTAIFVSRRWLHRSRRHAIVTGLGASFSNTVLLGIPLAKLAFGDTGLVILLTIISFHTLILFTLATVLLEMQIGPEPGADGEEPSPHPGKSRAMFLLESVGNTLLQPVVLPILVGLAWSFTGWTLPETIDAPLAMLSTASGPCSLVLLGASLAQFGIADHWRRALGLTAFKLFCYPAIAWLFGRYVVGISGVPLAIVTLTAALPIGANVYLFAQRYKVAQGEITAAVALSTGLSVLTLGGVLLLLG